MAFTGLTLGNHGNNLSINIFAQQWELPEAENLKWWRDSFGHNELIEEEGEIAVLDK